MIITSCPGSKYKGCPDSTLQKLIIASTYMPVVSHPESKHKEYPYTTSTLGGKDSCWWLHHCIIAQCQLLSWWSQEIRLIRQKPHTCGVMSVVRWWQVWNSSYSAKLEWPFLVGSGKLRTVENTSNWNHIRMIGSTRTTEGHPVMSPLCW